MIRIKLLGRFVVEVDGRPLPEAAWRGRRAPELVQLLALADGRRSARELVVDRLWPDRPLRSGVANLHKAAHHARRAIGVADAVVLRGGVVALLPAADVEIDSATFESAATAALASGDAAACGDVADTYAGDLLPDAPYAPWTEAPRRHLRRLRAELLRCAARWRDLVELDPTDEQAHRGIMRELVEAGRPHAALRQYRRLTEALAREAGAPRPSGATRMLYETVAAHVAHDTRTAFVGREIELVRLRAAMRDAADGPVRVILVRGDAGIGKTALCRHLVAWCGDHGWTVLAVDAEIAGDTPYGVLREVVREARATLDSDRVPGSDVLDRFLTPAADDPPLVRQQVLGVVAGVLDAVTATRRTLLLIDDAHEADDGSLDLLVVLTGSAVRGPLTTVLAHRGGADVFEATRAGLRLRGAMELDLGPLSDAEGARLARQVAGADVSDDVITRVLELAGGHPFFVRELAAVLARGPAGPLPERLTSVVRAGLSGLSPGTVALVEQLAVAAAASDLDTVLAASSRTEDEVAACLDQALEHGVLQLADGRYVFRHALLRQVLVEQVPPHQRAALHRRLASALARRGAPAAVVADHWVEGGRAAQAAPWLVRAAGEAARTGAPRDALRLLDRAAELAPDDPDVLAARADLLLTTGDPSAPVVYARAAKAAAGAAAIDLCARQAWALVTVGDVAGARSILAELPDEPGTAGVRVDLVRGYVQWLAGETDAASSTATRARVAALRDGSPADVVDALMLEGLTAHAREGWPRLIRGEILRTPDVSALAGVVYDVHLCLAETWLYGAVPYRDVIAFATDLEAAARDAGRDRGVAFAITLRGEAELLSGRLTSATDHLRHAAARYRAVGAAGGEALALQRLAEAAVLAGRPDEASEPLAQGFAAARASPLALRHLLTRLHGTAIRAAPSPARAHDLVLEAEQAVVGPAEMCTACVLPLAVPAAIAAADAGDLERADAHATAAARSAWMIRRPAWDAALLEVDGHLATARGDTAAAAEAFEGAARGFAELGQPVDEARCHRQAS